MGASVSTQSKGVTPEMNVTPLVDVVLVLLIIFMVIIAPSLEHGERVELPAIFLPDKAQKAKLDPITVTVGAGGTLYFEKDVVEAPALEAKLKDVHAQEPDRRVVIKGDSTLPYRKVRDVFVTVQGVGFKGVSLMVQKRGKPGEKDDEG
jgi:biopolymer transport protein ExbD/biopolymer transport protein TolR